MDSASPALRKAARSPQVPMLPAGVPYLLSAMADENLDLNGLARVLGRFPAITARLLTLANSAWARPARPVTSLANACAVLGLRVIRSVSIALAVAHPFQPGRCPGFDAVRYWQSAFLAAEGAPLLEAHAGEGHDAETLRTVALLHNIGLLWLADAWAEQTAAAFGLVASGSAGGLCEALRTCVGFDYCEAGGILGEAWQLPEALTAALRHHRDTGYRGRHWRLAASCGVAALTAGALLRDVALDAAGPDPLELGEDGRAAIGERMARLRESVGELARTLFPN